MEKRYNLLKTASRILDLGAAPGSWTEVALQRAPSTSNIVAVDLLDLDVSLLDSVNFVKGDFLEAECQERVRAALGDDQADLMLSDMVRSKIHAYPALTFLSSWKTRQAIP